MAWTMGSTSLGMSASLSAFSWRTSPASTSPDKATSGANPCSSSPLTISIGKGASTSIGPSAVNALSRAVSSRTRWRRATPNAWPSLSSRTKTRQCTLKASMSCSPGARLAGSITSMRGLGSTPALPSGRITRCVSASSPLRGWKCARGAMTGCDDSAAAICCSSVSWSAFASRKLIQNVMPAVAVLMTMIATDSHSDSRWRSDRVKIRLRP